MCLKAERRGIWHPGKDASGKSDKVILWFQVFGGKYSETIIPMFLNVGDNSKVPQGSKLYVAWVIANGSQKPTRGRLKEMPLSIFEKKIFHCEVVDVTPTQNGHPLPDALTYSRVDAVYELVTGNAS